MDLPNPGIKPRSPSLIVDSLPAKPPGKHKNAGVGSLSLLQQIFLTQESNQDLLHYRRMLYQLSYEGRKEIGTASMENRLCRWLSSKESTCNAGDAGSILGSGRSPGEGNGYPLQYSCLENPRGQRSLAGYSPWGCKESDTTEQLSTAHSQKKNVPERFTELHLIEESCRHSS